MRTSTISVAVTLLLASCTAAQHGKQLAMRAPAAATTSATIGSTQRHFTSARYGFRIDYPATMRASHAFATSYLANGTWKTYAGADSRGTPVLALSLEGSNKITAGELRIGASNDAKQIKQCSEPPATLRPGSVGGATINGIHFTYFEAGDAAMSHYLAVQSYRTVHAGRCYAIDLLVVGTRPEVYDPPATPPFTQRQAFARLHKVLQGFRFTTRTP